MAIFPTFFVGNIRQEKVFYDILEEKDAFLGYKKKKFKKLKNWHFSKPMVLIQKWLLLQLLFLGNIRQEKVFYDILERKNVFLSYKKQ